MVDPVSLRFRWEEPTPGDWHNFDSVLLGAACVKVGRIGNDQVVARVFRGKPVNGDEAFGRESFAGKLVTWESHDGGSSKYLGNFHSVDAALDNVENYL